MGTLCVLRILENGRAVALTRMQHQLGTAEGLDGRAHTVTNSDSWNMANNKSGPGPWTMVSVVAAPQQLRFRTADRAESSTVRLWMWGRQAFLVALPRPFVTYPSSGAWLAGFASLKNKTPHGRTGYEVLSTTFILLDRVVRYDKSH
jgi:hypothetical protein